jgi:hypothetical protein
MGAFNVAGTMSNISIGPGRKVVFIPLLPTRYCYNGEGSVEMHPQTMIVSNDGASAYYSPRFLPIVGEYNDYGTLENIERDDNVEYIEQYFEMSIDDFMSVITCSIDLDFRERKKLGEKKTKELQSLSGMFEVYDVYKKMIQYSIEMDDAANAVSMTDYVLELLGFVATDKPTKNERFSKRFIHSDIPELEVHSDGRFCRGYFSGEEFGCYHPSYLKERLEEEKIELPQFKKFKGVSQYGFRFDEECQKNSEEPNEIEEILKEVEKEFLENHDLSDEELQEKMKNVRRAFESQIALRNMADRRSGIMPFHKMDYVLTPKFREQYIQLMEFSKIMFCTNNFFFPAMNGEQEGNPDATRKLANVVLEFLDDDGRGEEY